MLRVKLSDFALKFDFEHRVPIGIKHDLKRTVLYIFLDSCLALLSTDKALGVENTVENVFLLLRIYIVGFSLFTSDDLVTFEDHD